MKPTFFAVLTAIALPAAGFAQTPSIEIADSYARSANPKAAGAFMTIRNTGTTDCTLSAISTPAAEKAELHTHKDEGGGVMKMVKMDGGITIPAGAEHQLARGGDHVMLMGLTSPLKNGQEVTLTLDFGPCGTVETVLPVDNERKPAAMAPMNHGAHAMPATN